ncbi:MAG: 23S rRNA pseudouridine955/2504/2580 synthase [Bacteroidia bacterium]
MKRFKFKDQIVFENDNYMAICKPAGISSLHERIGNANSVIEQAKLHDENLQLCHRLDKETSGVLLLSKHSKAYSHAAVSFEKRRVAKTYHAVSDGIHNFDKFEVNLPLITTRSGRSAVNKQKGKPCTTLFSTLENYRHFTLIECNPITGRQHQIRIHLASQSAPIAADTIYGGKQPYLSKLKKNFTLNRTEEERPMIARFALHAHTLEFKDMDGETLKISADYPKDIAVFLKQLRKFNT